MLRSETLINLGISGAAPAIAAIFTNPLDVAKTRLQMQLELRKRCATTPVQYSGPFDCLRQTLHREGMRGVQRGLGIAMVREGSKCFFRIGLFAPILSALHPAATIGKGFSRTSPSPSHNAPFWKKLLAGSASGLVAAIVCNPLDLVKSRLQASGNVSNSHHTYRNSFEAFDKIYRNEGGVGALWKGYRINIARSIIFTSAMMATNSEAHYLMPQHGIVSDGPFRDATCALVAAVVAVMLMNPVDVLRTRMYNQPAGPHAAALYPDTSIFGTARQIIRCEGVSALWKGAVAHCARAGPHTTLTFVLIGEMKKRVGTK
jgi:solute carrier family 25 protein 34/35